jgi:hypothetical protein
VRLSIINELAPHRQKPGVATLLRLLSTARDPATRAAARSALPHADRAAPGEGTTGAVAPLAVAPVEAGAPLRTLRGGAGRPESAGLAVTPAGTRLARCLVSPVDGWGRGSIVISVTRTAQRRTVAFLCDLQRGIRDVVGEVEPESPSAGGLLDELNDQAGCECARDAPELALGLLAGSLMLCGPAVSPLVREWLDGTLGPEFQPAGLPIRISGVEPAPIPGNELPGRVQKLLDACPSWLDRSPLTFELAEEIWLREGRPAAETDRDAGVYRYLFEHRLIHRLELYRRMLFWMAWLWKSSGQMELSRSALALAGQLSDEQYAVPSHPFTVELTTRSLRAAQAELRTEADPRLGRGGA